MNNNIDDDKIVEIYWALDDTGKLQQHEFVTVCPRVDERYIPDLEFSEKWAEYFKWKNDKLIKNELRWGKDDLRKRGFESARLRNEAGKLVTVYYLPTEEEKIEQTK